MNPYLFIGLETTALLLKEEAARFNPNQYESRPDIQRLSMREVCAHLADWEPIMLTRITNAIKTPGCTLTVYDEEVMARENRYDLKNPQEEMVKFVEARMHTIESLREFSPAQFRSVTYHPERGELQAGDIAHMLVCHDLYHLEQIRTMK